jgi:16S rRNA (cytosine1402-N4)-methyltransferase
MQSLRISLPWLRRSWEKRKGMKMKYHNPVLLKECIHGLNILEGGTYVDVTFGGGGHSAAILENLEKGKLYVFDQDPDAAKNEIEDDRLVFIKANFRHLKRFMKFYNAIPVNGILADLGVSSHQFDVPDRGFSTRFDALLDMRMDKAGKLSAKEVINNYTEDQLKSIFGNYGEIHNASKLAHAICEARQAGKILTVEQLKQASASCLPKGKENQYFAQMFQAIRMDKGGRLAVISYHSLEDRIVKNFFSKGKFEGEREKDFYGKQADIPFRQITKKPIVVSVEELKINPRSRSAKLRIAEKN